jgi:hypothetical protein
MTEFRALCAELVDALDSGIPAGRIRMSPLADRARALLAQPVAEGPTDEELLRVAATAIDPYESSGIALGEYEPETECAVEVYGSELIAYARAVLARWGNSQAILDSSPQPVAVSERLPGPEDCDEQGRCWWHRYTPTKEWHLQRVYIGQYTHWLPANALPTSTPENQ